jgi:hypothetical protein
MSTEKHGKSNYLSYGSHGFHFVFMAQQPIVGQDLHIVEVLWSHSDAPQTVGLLWTKDQPNVQTSTRKAQHSQETDIHVHGRIRTRNPSKRAVANPRLRPSGHWDRPWISYPLKFSPNL